MRVEVIMPKMGESIHEGTLIKWHKKKGDKVSKDEIIFEIATDKVDTEIPSSVDGILAEIKVFENETVDIDTVVAIIETDSESAEPAPKKEVVKDPAEDLQTTTKVGGNLIDVVMPKMGESVMEGTIIKWHKSVGDKVERDEILFEIATDKVDTEVPAISAGTLVEIFVKENETVDVETVVGRISSEGGLVKGKESEIRSQKSEEEILETTAKETVLGENSILPADKAGVKSETEKQSHPIGESNRFYSPLVLNIARKEGISFDELESLSGTGVGGRVSKRDILAYLKDRKSGKVFEQKATKVEVEKGTAQKDGVEIIPMDNIRKRIMQHMLNSRDTSVHVTAITEVEMTIIDKFLKEKKKKFMEEDGVKLTFLSFIARATVKALREYPMMNASLEGENILLKKFVNLGIAVAIEPNGLIVPNIKNADEINTKGLSRAIADLGFRARNKKLLPDEISGGTFSITNYGVFGSLFGTPIINQPEVGILGVGAVVKKPVVVTIDDVDSIAIKPMMYLSLSHDHRLVDGLLGGKFLKYVKDYLENFDTSKV
ncbi:MAG: 2-oxoglutarate dehydrogenase, E2 component, dihydrolipoamide succinyltransferase [Bacteroidetes bacterium]|nr:2-oxoglutarate dehydrogenase, E2 component, dihydrolipoamide succinyltransferase [Bacteroidota bacterium]